MAKEKNRPGMMLYFDTFAVMRKYLAPEELAAAMCQLVDYAEHGIEPIDLPGAAAVAFDLIKPRLDRDAEAYEDKVRGSQYGGFVKKCKAEGLTAAEIPSREDWDGTMTVPKPMVSHTKPMATVPKPMESAPNLNRTITRNRTITTTELELETEREREGGSRRNSAGGSRRPSEETNEKYEKGTLPRWADAPETMKEEIGELTREVFSKFVPSRLPEKADALKMYERVCAVDDDGKIYVNAERARLVCEAFAHVQEAGTPGNMVAIYRYLRDAEKEAGA